MDWLVRLFTEHWQHKLLALFAALILWIFVNYSITETKAIPNVPVRVINLPQDKTISGMLPGGYLKDRIALTLTGRKDAIIDLESSDLEVQIDASTSGSDNWAVTIIKGMLVSLNPAFDPKHHITHVRHNEFILKLSNLVEEKVPIRIKHPIGHSPSGYEFLDIWPYSLEQTVSGPKEEVEQLRMKGGLKLYLNLDLVTKEQLDQLIANHTGSHEDEVNYFVPDKYKKVMIPFENSHMQKINDPNAKDLRITFLRKKVHRIGKPIPVQVFYPMKTSHVINPTKYPLVEGSAITIQNGVPYLKVPLYTKNVSRLFLDVILEHLQIMITANPNDEKNSLPWSLEVINPHKLEDRYVALSLEDPLAEARDRKSAPFKHEEHLRKRFREYLFRLKLLTSPNKPLELKASLEQDSIEVEIKKR
ncbi:MAG: hypothetical protein WD595_04115 [Waddliaceae bacterium]